MKTVDHATIERKQQELNQLTYRRFEDINEQALEGVYGGFDSIGNRPSLSRSSSSASSGGESFHSAITNLGGHWANNKKIYGYSAGAAAATALTTIITSQLPAL